MFIYHFFPPSHTCIQFAVSLQLDELRHNMAFNVPHTALCWVVCMVCASYPWNDNSEIALFGCPLQIHLASASTKKRVEPCWAKAKKATQTDWKDLLPVAAHMNLQAALKLPRMRALLQSSAEVAINLDQNVGHQVRWNGNGGDFSLYYKHIDIG